MFANLYVLVKVVPTLLLAGGSVRQKAKKIRCRSVQRLERFERGVSNELFY